ncbi:MAG: hypothetical protein ACFFE6_13135 [Candidatus Thorarchaeota archaeon]
MGQVSGSDWENRILLVLFVFITVSFAVAGFSGLAWRILELTVFSFWMVIITFALAISAVTVLTYSFVSFSQSREVRHLMLLLMSANIILWGILFLLSHPSSIDWSVLFSERNRNRTLAMALVLIVIPTVILGSFTGELKPSRPSVLLLIVWGTVILPILSIGLFISPDPVFIMVTSEGGIEGLTPIGAALSLGYLISQVLAVPRLAQIWRRTRNTLDLALLLAMILWLIGTVFIIVLWDPLQVAELIWLTSIIAGFLLIASVQFITSIIYPHRHLETMVNQRTEELNLSKQESEFYLRMWTHKIGNFLQGMITYLDILEISEQNSEEDLKTRAAAGDLSREAAMVNHQVVQLSRIKESMDQVLWPVNLVQLIDDAIMSANELFGEDIFTTSLSGLESLTVEGDNLLPLAFQSAIAFHLKNRVTNKPAISFEMSENEAGPFVKVTSQGRPLPEELKLFLEGDGISGMIALDLDLFTIKLLMNRYKATIGCSRDDEKNENSCTFVFPRV